MRRHAHPGGFTCLGFGLPFAATAPGPSPLKHLLLLLLLPLPPLLPPPPPTAAADVSPAAGLGMPGSTTSTRNTMTVTSARRATTTTTTTTMARATEGPLRRHPRGSGSIALCTRGAARSTRSGSGSLCSGESGTQHSPVVAQRQARMATRGCPCLSCAASSWSIRGLLDLVAGGYRWRPTRRSSPRSAAR